jgi:ABC-type polysaccharide/polyol phosphate transport system ATPase subunit
MKPNASPLISLNGAGVFRAGRWLVRGVDLSVSKGEIVTLIGPNGSGKSTTARMALGIMAADEGTAFACTGRNSWLCAAEGQCRLDVTAQGGAVHAPDREGQFG